MEKIEIEKYIKTFKDEQGNVIGYGIVGNITELIKELEENNKVIKELKKYKPKLHLLKYSQIVTSNRALKKLMSLRTIQACEELIQ